MTSELPDFTHLPLLLYARANYRLFVQFLIGFAILLVAIIMEMQGYEFIPALLRIAAALVLVIFFANFAGFLVKWNALRRDNFAVIGKIIAAIQPDRDDPHYYQYTVEYSDPEGTRREAVIGSEPWEKRIFVKGEKIKILYDPLKPQDITNYSAYEFFK